MAESPLPYVTAYGNITKVLEKIKSAETPGRFTQDFLATTLDMPGGSAKPVIPFLKRTGFHEEGHARNYLLIDGKWQDHVLFAILREDWRG